MADAKTFQELETEIAEIAHRHGVVFDARPDRVVFQASYSRRTPNWKRAREAVLAARGELGELVAKRWGDADGKGHGVFPVKQANRHVWGCYLGRDLDGAGAGAKIPATEEALRDLRLRGISTWRAVGRYIAGGRLAVTRETASRGAEHYTVPPMV